MNRYQCSYLNRDQFRNVLLFITKITVLSFASIFFIWFIWYSLAFLIASNRGIDLTDEGLYLLAADPPIKYASWGFPSGWHTAPLFELVDFDIANFRTLGAFLLFVVGLGAGYQISSLSWAKYQTPNHSSNNENIRLIYLIGATLIGGVGCLMYYAGLLRSPSYNWLALVGMLVAGTGAIGVIRMLEERKHLSVYAYCITVSVGLFVSLPGKASVAPMAWVWCLCVWSIFLGINRAAMLSLIVGGVTLSLIGLAWFTGLWAENFPLYFLAWLDPSMPRFVPSHGVTGALLAVVFVPWEFINSLLSSPASNLAWVAIMFVLLSTIMPQTKHNHLIMYSSAAIALAACAWAAKIPQGLIQSTPAASRFTFAPAVTASTLVACLLLILSFAQNSRNRNAAQRLVLFMCLMGYPIIFVFGTSTSPYAQMAMAVVFVYLAGLVAISAMKPKMLIISLLVLSAFGVLQLAATLSDSWRLPYRIKPLSQQTHPVKFGDKQSELFLDEQVAHSLNSLREDAERAGWKAGTPMLGVCWSWSTTVPYFMGAKVPSSLIVTLFGYPTSVGVGSYISGRYLADFTLNSAWILAGDMSDLTQPIFRSEQLPKKEQQKRLKEQKQLLDYISRYSDRHFPEDYIQVSNTQYFQLWKPR